MGKKRISKRQVDTVILSDIHLGAFGCHAKELLMYLRSIKPRVLILNGDIIDIWQFRKRYFPKSHLMVIRHLTGLIAKNTRVIYMNSGDWVENLSALEYDKGEWRIYLHA